MAAKLGSVTQCGSCRQPIVQLAASQGLRTYARTTRMAGSPQGNRSLVSTHVPRAVASELGTASELNAGIAKFYDASTPVWEDIWGEHMHHGYYDSQSWSLTSFSAAESRQAQVRMIEETLAWAGISDQEGEKPKTVVDVGCGIGGSARHLASKYGATVTGITLSPVQAQRATDITASRGLASQVSFQVADALNQPFPDGQYDLVWSMESGEHMPDKQKFVQELARVTAPGGKIIIVTWCHRDLLPGEASITASEKALLDKICDAYYLPAWCSTSDYVKLAESAGLLEVRSADWSDKITPFWPAVVASALTFRGFVGLIKSGWTTIRGAIAMAYMIQGFQRGLIKFALITGQKAQ